MSRGIVCLVALGTIVLAGSPAPAQNPPVQLPPGAASPSQKTGTARIRGRIVAADSGQPLRKAQVRASAADIRESRVTSTDADGHFELKELPAGRYTIAASKGSFVALQYGQRRPFVPGKPIELRDGETIEKVDFALPRGGIVTGHVTDEFGEPVADVSVAPMPLIAAPLAMTTLATCGSRIRAIATALPVASSATWSVNSNL